jgi:molybdate transport system substrate-binding protein
LKRGASNEAARSFLAFLQGPEARAVTERYGYVLPGGPS